MESGKHVVFMPTFMFGVQQHVLDQLYGGADGIPTIGDNIEMLSKTITKKDNKEKNIKHTRHHILVQPHFAW